MPFTVRSAPPDVKKRHKGHCLEVWVEVFNSTFKRHRDEGRAFATAESAGKKCEDAMTGKKAAERSFDELRQAVSDSLRASRGSTDLWVVEMYDDRVVYSEGGHNWEAPYAVDDDGSVTFEERTAVERVVTYQPLAVKFEDGSDTKISGLAIPFGGPFAGKDIDGEDFGPDTDLCLDWFPDGRPLLYHHGLNGAVKTEVVGHQTALAIKDDGAWVQGELDKASRWYAKVKKLLEKGALGFSSGAMAHLVKTRKDGHIERWPWVELSFTPTRANPAAVAYAVKADRGDFLIDEAGGSEDGPYSDHGERVLADVGGFLERTDDRAEMRGKVGRSLSVADRDAMTRLDGHLAGWEEQLAKKRQRIQEALTRTDPDASKAVVELEAELLVSELRREGVLA